MSGCKVTQRYHIDYGNFIGSWLIDESVCDQLVDYHKNSKDKFAGQVGHTNLYGSAVNTKIKDSVDVIARDKILNVAYFNCLETCLSDYKSQYEHCDFEKHGVIENVHIQYYEPPNGGFHKFHFERNSIKPPVIYRHLVFMTYLNTVNDGGETEFFYQKLKIKPVKGLTLIWPAEWTHTHRGNPSPKEHKYIITGWISHVPYF